MPHIHRKTLFALLIALLATCLSTSLTFAQSGAWTLLSSPNVGTNGNHLFGVAAVSANDIWAVGDYNDGPNMYHSRTLAEHWNGSSWSIVASPNPATGSSDDDQLQAVAAVSSNNVWAVGYISNNDIFAARTLIEHWNGASWSVVPSPNPTVSQYLYGVTAISASDIWAVGYFTDQQTQAGSGSLTLHWNGTTWSRVSNPGNTRLNGVTAVSSNNVWAVGDYTIQQNLDGPLILHWDGSSWSIVPSSQVGTLAAVTAVSASNIWAVGYEYNGYYYTTVIQHWNGTKWSQVSSPNPYGDDLFNGVTALSATSVWAVGFASGEPLVEKWNGTKWTGMDTANVNTFDTFEAATTIPATGDVWAVGYSLHNSSVGRTLTERCNGC